MRVDVGRYAHCLEDVRRLAKPIGDDLWHFTVNRESLPTLRRLQQSFVSDHVPPPAWAIKDNATITRQTVQAVDFSIPMAAKDHGTLHFLAKGLERAVLNGADPTEVTSKAGRFMGLADLATKHETKHPVSVDAINAATVAILENFGYPDTLLIASDEQLEDPRPREVPDYPPPHVEWPTGRVTGIRTAGGNLTVVRQAPTEHVFIGQFDPEIAQLVWHTPPSLLEHPDGSFTAICVAALALYAPKKWAVL